MPIVGIDLGTTNSLIGVWEDGQSKLIENSLGKVLTPSVVGLDDTGELLVGEAARDRLITHPELSVAAFKRWMGSERITRLGNQSFRPEELSAMVLRALKQDAERYLAEEVVDAVISVPAYFNDTQRKATIAAGKLAGLNVERLINEPTAAALAYGLEQEDDSQFLVFDLGGGTFDVSIMELFDRVMEVHASSGDNRLGGEDFRQALADLLVERHQLDLDKMTAGDQHRLLLLAEQIKVELSGSHEFDYQFRLEEDLISGRLTRRELEDKVQPLLKRLTRPLERAIRDAGMSVAEIEKIILVGGATRMPAIRNAVGRLFGKLPLSHMDPDCIVAHGAVKQAALKARNEDLSDVVMTDVCPYSLGVGAYNTDQGHSQEPVMVPIIERNAVVPTSQNSTFSTMQDFQTEIELQVFQGESLRLANNIHLGGLSLRVPRAQSGEESVDVRFTYDVNGILEVLCTVLSTGQESRLVIQSSGTTLSDEEIEKRLKALEKLKMPPWEQAENRALIARAERLYEELLGSNRAELGQAIGLFRQRISDQHNREIDQDRARFKDYLDQLSLSVFDGE